MCRHITRFLTNRIIHQQQVSLLCSFKMEVLCRMLCHQFCFFFFFGLFKEKEWFVACLANNNGSLSFTESFFFFGAPNQTQNDFLYFSHRVEPPITQRHLVRRVSTASPYCPEYLVDVFPTSGWRLHIPFSQSIVFAVNGGMSYAWERNGTSATRKRNNKNENKNWPIFP